MRSQYLITLMETHPRFFKPQQIADTRRWAETATEEQIVDAIAKAHRHIAGLPEKGTAK